MPTVEQAKELWCPMVRIAQVGAIETSAAYNRALIKAHVPVSLKVDEGDPIDATILKTDIQLSAASRCLGDGCAMWRWSPDTLRHPDIGNCGLAPVYGVAA